ncbi:glycosyltransferase [Romeria aff. gracilis LEGE 07310]|uniref:Glycosyltransferase n=1 Tax=Vasconcelosia minhoensis LEGE 07310 TaxID=915328 RepID=A0A8J7DK04_9CYAN|nr:glycosyltransferase [Romeria gracilis]MBE9075756.1 glycosyltransferase [Romeria aff. gracilis LEGE 07310]
MTLPLISLVMAVYNREPYLAQALDSLLTQTYPHFEAIIWDDGSTDRSADIAHAYAQKDRRIRHIAAKHQGQGYALHSAFSFTQGQFLASLDSDDWLAPTALEETSQLLNEEPDVGMVYTDYTDVNASGKPLGLGHRCAIPYSQDRLLLDFMTFHFRLIRRSTFEQVGGIDPKFAYAPDYDLCLKLSELTDIVHLRRPLYFYRRHSGAISSQKQWQQIEFSHRAVSDAIERRGLAEKIAVSVQLQPKFIFSRRSQPESAGKVFGIGLDKTGMASLAQALSQLGYRTLQSQNEADLVICEAAADPSFATSFRALDWRYPGSKFILTVREMENWLTAWQQEAQAQKDVSRELKSLRRQTFGQWQFEPQVWQQVYQAHLSDVVGYFKGRERDLLVFQPWAGEGWNKLCPFLGKPLPARAFPIPSQDADPKKFPCTAIASPSKSERAIAAPPYKKPSRMGKAFLLIQTSRRSPYAA